MSRYILDSSALLAVIYREPGADKVERIFNHAALSSVNLAECMSVMALRGLPAKEASATLLAMVPEIVPFDKNLALIAAEMSPDAKPLGLSLGDRACLATAIHLNLEVVTADRIWAKIKGGPKISLIR